MTHVHLSLVPRTPFDDLSIRLTSGCGVIASVRNTLELAAILVRRGKASELRERVRQCFGIELPSGPQRVAGGDLALLATGPGAWLAAREGGWKDFGASLREAIGDLASISDQSDGYVVLRLTGSKLRETLAKMIPVDLHSKVFECGTAAVTTVGHIGATLWRLDNSDAGSPVFEIAVGGSMAADFWRILSESAI